MHQRFNHPISLSFKVLLVLLVSCQSGTTLEQAKVIEGLQSVYSDYFAIGVSVGPKNLEREDESELIKKEFGSLTAENVMKMGPIHPKPAIYNWAPADAIADFAVANNMKMRGHALIWHQQYPEWFFKDENGDRISKDTLYARMKQHINDVMTRYKGKIYAWDVVNEAVSDNPNFIYRQDSPFYEIAGEEYLEKAFQYAHEADPNAILFYNDYNATQPTKSKNIYALIKTLKDKNIPVHGIGLQGHWNIFSPTREELSNALELYSSLGLDLQITELDVSVYKGESGRREIMEEEDDTFTPELAQKQIEKYKMIFEIFREYETNITAVTFWNVSDRSSWLDNFPVRGRKNYPLLFDQQLNRKDAYEAVIQF
jgi:endo-1,4-beta-xylanase